MDPVPSDEDLALDVEAVSNSSDELLKTSHQHSLPSDSQLSTYLGEYDDLVPSTLSAGKQNNIVMAGKSTPVLLEMVNHIS